MGDISFSFIDKKNYKANINKAYNLAGVYIKKQYINKVTVNKCVAKPV